MPENVFAQGEVMDRLVADALEGLAPARRGKFKVWWFARPGKVARIFIRRYTTKDGQGAGGVDNPT